MKKYFVLLSIILLSRVALFAQVQEPKQSQIQELSDTIWTHPLLVGETMAIKFSPDGKYIYTGSAGSDADIITKIDVVTNKVVKVFNTKPNFRFLDLTNDGKSLLIATTKQLYLVNAETGDSLREFEIPKNQGVYVDIVSISISFDNKYAGIIIRLDKTPQDRLSSILVWELETGKLVANMEVNTQVANCLKFSPTENILAVGLGSPNSQTSSSPIRLYEVGTWNLLKSFDGHRREIGDLRFSPDGNYLASWCGTDSNLIKIWDIKNRKLKQNINNDKYLMYGAGDVSFLNNNSIIVSSENLVNSKLSFEFTLVNLIKETKTVIAQNKNGSGYLDINSSNSKNLLAVADNGASLYNLYNTLDVSPENNNPIPVLFPNPVTKELNISIKEVTNMPVSYRIINNVGQEVLHNSTFVQNNILKINTSNLSRGAYILNLQYNNTSKSFNFIIQ